MIKIESSELLIVTVISVFICAHPSAADDQRRYHDIIARLDNLTREVEHLKKDASSSKHQPVTFVAYLSRSIPGKHNRIIFDDVKLNVGNSYSGTHGNFIAPVSGMYQFTITACAPARNYIVLELAINSAVVDKVLAGDHYYSSCNTGVYPHRLTVGDEVRVQHYDRGDFLLRQDKDSLPMFTGVLLYSV